MLTVEQNSKNLIKSCATCKFLGILYPDSRLGGYIEVWCKKEVFDTSPTEELEEENDCELYELAK